MIKIVNFNKYDSNDGLLSDELKAEAQALNNYIRQLNLSCEENNTLVNMVFTHIQNIAKEIFDIGVDVGIDLITNSDIDK